MFKSGFITIVGRPNVGKSTLTNLLMGEKLSIVSNKPQTTRNNIQNIPLFILFYKNKFCPVRLLTNYFKKTIVLAMYQSNAMSRT